MTDNVEKVDLTKLLVEAKRTFIKDIVAEANSSFVTIDFFKKDGTIRSMNIQHPSVQNHLVTEYKSESTKQAVETRKKNHPELMNTWDVQKHEIRSINLDTVFRVAAKGKVYEFEGVNPAAVAKSA